VQISTVLLFLLGIKLQYVRILSNEFLEPSVLFNWNFDIPKRGSHQRTVPALNFASNEENATQTQNIHSSFWTAYHRKNTYFQGFPNIRSSVASAEDDRHLIHLMTSKTDENVNHIKKLVLQNR
jgi:hypothetical protein